MKNYIELLKLEKHIEGGYFSQYYKSSERVSVSHLSEISDRSSGSAIYFLLEGYDFSAWHRLRSDEIWHYYDGTSPIDIHVIESGKLVTYTLGNPTKNPGASFQVIIKAGCWFAAEVRDKTSFGLVGCTVSPGFEYQDFELGNKMDLIGQYPELSSSISKFIHDSSLSAFHPGIPKAPPHEMSYSSHDYINLLGLERHREGGYFSVFYTSNINVTPLAKRYFSSTHNKSISFLKDSDRKAAQRSAGSSIYFMLEYTDFSAWHRLKSDEIWHYYDGKSSINIHTIDSDGNIKTYILGNPSHDGNASFQVVIKSGCWFAAEVCNKSSFGLVGCTVSPGFEYDDFELANRESLLSQYPHLSNEINKFTRSEEKYLNKIKL